MSKYYQCGLPCVNRIIPLFVLFFDSLAIFLACLRTFGWNRCFAISSLVMSFGCFFMVIL